MLQRCGGCGGKYVIGLLRCPVIGCGVMSAMYAAVSPVPQITIGAPAPPAVVPPRRKPAARRRAPVRAKPGTA